MVTIDPVSLGLVSDLYRPTMVRGITGVNKSRIRETTNTF